MSEMNHECAVAGMMDFSGRTNVIPQVATMLKQLQNRGDMGAGLAWRREGEERLRSNMIETYKATGLVKDILSASNLNNHAAYSSMAIGQDRYATNGSNDPCYLQPFRYSQTPETEEYAFVWNGNIPDCTQQIQFLESQGVELDIRGDTEVIGRMIGQSMIRSETLSLRRQMQNAFETLDGAFNPIIMTQNKIVALRDRHGFHPLVYARHRREPWIAFASEDIAIDDLPTWKDAEFFDIRPGQVIEVKRDEQRVIIHDLWDPEPKLCFFEAIYFADHRAIIDGISVANVRFETGKILAEQDAGMSDTDIVVAVPLSAEIAATGYKNTRGLRKVDVIKKNPDIGRSFIAKTPEERRKLIRMKYNIDRELLTAIGDRNIILVDDSLVRGSTMEYLIEYLHEQGARNIHLRLASPPIMSPCFYGIDFPTVKELMARKYYNGTLKDGDVLPDDVLQAIADHLKLKSIKYLPKSGIPRALGKDRSQICMACVTGEYPTPNGQRLYDIQSHQPAVAGPHSQSCPRASKA